MALQGYTTLNLQINDDGTIAKWENSMVSLQKQVRYLRQELSNTSYNDAQRQSVRLLLADAQMGLQATQTRSRELFGTLSLLPGAMGNFFGTVQMTLVALRELSQLSFADLKSQFQILQSTFTGENLAPKVGQGIGNATTTAGGTAGGNLISQTAEGSALGGIAAQTTKATTDAIKNETNAKEGLVSVNGVLITQQQAMLAAARPLADSYKNQGENQKLLEESYKNLSFEVANHKLLISQVPFATREVTQEEKNLLRANESLFISEEGLVKVIKDLTFAQQLQVVWWTISTNAVKLYNNVITFTTNLVLALTETFLSTFVPGVMLTQRVVTLLAATINTLGFAGIAAAIGIATAALYEWITGTQKAENALHDFNEELKNTQLLNELNANSDKKNNAERIARLQERNSTEKKIRLQEIQDVKDDYNKLVDEIIEAKAIENKALENSRKIGSKETEDDLKRAQDNVLKLEDKQREALNQIRIKTSLDVRDTNRKIYEDTLRDFDARIELEIRKENTSKENLTKLYKDRNKLVDDFNVNIDLSEKERQLRKKNDDKKVNDAIIDDLVRRLKAEQDIQKRAEIEDGVKTAEYFKAKRADAQKQFEIDMAEAGRDALTKQTNEKNARTNFYKASLDIDKEELQAKIELSQLYYENEYNNTAEAFKAKKDLETAQYNLRVANARGNYELLEQLAIDHKNKLGDIDDEEMTYKASLEKRKSETEQENYSKSEKNFFKSYGTIIDLNKRKYDDLREQEQYSYEVARDNAEGNDKELEIIEREHAAKMRELKQQEFEANRQLDLMTLDATKTIGNDISSIGDVLIQEKQGRDRQAFETGKKLAVAGIAIEKASAIGQIWENNAVANAKAIAAFPLTLGQPWVTLNTVTAGISTAATIAAAASAISQINGTAFQPSYTGRGLGKNYGDGGLIDGPSHAQGGVPLTAEGGEAIMSRGAVTMFAPLLSLMNQAGGGTSFNKGANGSARYDNPKSIGGPNEQPIIKTYVVEGDLTTAQHKAARLKSLSTL